MTTRNIVPRADGEGQLGTSAKLWLQVNAVTFGSLQRNATVEVGDIAFFNNKQGYYLECVAGGKTSASDISITATAGTLVTDGAVTWIVCNFKDPLPVGYVFGDTYLHDGCVRADGSIVKRAAYPRLVAMAAAKSLWTSDTANNLGLFGVGDGSSTMVLPNYVNRMIQFGSIGKGATVAAGLPNISGRTWSLYYTGGTTSAPFTRSIENASLYYIGNSGGNDPCIRGCHLDFNASNSSAIYGNSNTVQPAAIAEIAQIKY